MLCPVRIARQHEGEQEEARRKQNSWKLLREKNEEVIETSPKFINPWEPSLFAMSRRFKVPREREAPEEVDSRTIQLNDVMDLWFRQSFNVVSSFIRRGGRAGGRKKIIFTCRERSLRAIFRRELRVTSEEWSHRSFESSPINHLCALRAGIEVRRSLSYD